MDVAAAAGILEERFKDLGSNRFTATLRRVLLENAELYLASKLHKAYLTELETEETDVSLSSGSVALSSLTYDVLNGGEGILQVKITSGKICRRIDPNFLKDTESYFRTGSTDDPMFYVRHNKINVLPTSVASVVVSYLKMPDPLYFQFTSDQAASGESKTKFDGASGEGLSASNEAYNNAVIYNIEKASYHVVTDYVGADLAFTVLPAAEDNFTDGQNFRFITNGFDALSLSGIEFSLNQGLHMLIVDLAEAAGLAQTELDQQRIAAQSRAENTITVLNAKYIPPERLGTQ